MPSIEYTIIVNGKFFTRCYAKSVSLMWKDFYEFLGSKVEIEQRDLV